MPILIILKSQIQCFPIPINHISVVNFWRRTAWVILLSLIHECIGCCVIVSSEFDVSPSLIRCWSRKYLSFCCLYMGKNLSSSGKKEYALAQLSCLFYYFSAVPPHSLHYGDRFSCCIKMNIQSFIGHNLPSSNDTFYKFFPKQGFSTSMYRVSLN